MPYARKAKIVWEPGGYYHIYNRGARRLSIFRERENYDFVIRKLRYYAWKFHLTVIAFVLLPNHYHWLIRQNGVDRAGLLPQRVFNSYSKAYNKRYGHSGTLFEDRFKAIRVDKEDYMLHLCRYIHGNPVLHGIAPTVSVWPWSNYAEWMGARESSLVDRAFIRAYFPNNEAYNRFLGEYLRERKHPQGLEYLDEFDD